MTTAERTYLSCAETAKLVRQALARSFPGVKFSVRSSNYAGGASIGVRWTDGPLTRAVEAVAKQYEGADFDGSIDLKTYSSHYLRADGSVYLHHAQGTEGSMGCIPVVDNRALASVMPADVRIVRFGADSVRCSRDLSDFEGLNGQAAEWLAGYVVPDEMRPGFPPMFGNRYLSEISRSMAYLHIAGEDWKATYDRWTTR